MQPKKKKNELTILIGRRIALLRKGIGLSQQELEDKSISENGEKVLKYRTLSLIEQGYGEPKITTLSEIAKALEVPLFRLFDLDVSEKDAHRQQLINEAGFLLHRLDNDDLKIAINQLAAFLRKDKTNVG